MKTIVYVDDEKDLTENFDVIFDEDEFEVHTFNTHKSGLEFIKNNKIDVLFLDFRMPDGTALDFLKQCDLECKKVLVTGELDASTEEGIADAFDKIIEKPFNFYSILDIVS